jgi:hypothetical protein
MEQDGEGIRGGGLKVEAGTLAATDLRIDGAGEWGLVAFGGDVTVAGADVRDVTPRADGLRGRGVSLREGARGTLTDLRVQDVGEAGVVVSSEAIVSVTGATVRNAVGTADGAAGFGFVVITGGALTVVDADVSGAVAPAFAVQGDGTSLEVRDSVARENHGGANAEGGGFLLLDGVVLEDTSRWGLAVYSASAEVHDTTIRRIRREGDGVSAVGVALTESTLEASGLVIEDAQYVGLSILDHSAATLSDVVVRGTYSVVPEDRPAGVRVARDSVLIAEDLRIEGNEAVGLEVWDASIQLTDSQIVDTLSFGEGLLGRGLSIGGGAEVVAERVVVEGSQDVAVVVSEPATTLTLLDSRLALTRTSTGTSPGGALAVQNGAVVTVRGSVVEDNEGAGIYVAAAAIDVHDSELRRNGFAGLVCLGGTVLVEGSVIADTLPDPAHGGGVGIYARGLAGRCDLTVLDSTIQGLPGAALYLQGPGDTLLARSEVSDCGAPPSMAGGVMALDGVLAPATPGGEGLVIQGNRFFALGSDAILLDAAGAELRADPADGPNVFGDIDGLALYRQRCGPDTAVLDGSGADPTCRSAARPVGPRLDYPIRLVEVDPLD